jgi:folate-binding protein YgfZ
MLKQQWQQPPLLDTEESQGIALISGLGALAFEGSDAAAFLQGYLTSDTDMISGDLTPSALCDLKGRVFANGYVCGTPTRILLVLDTSLVQPVIEFLKRYMAFSKTSVADISEDALIFGSTGATPEGFTTIGDELGLAVAESHDQAKALATDKPLAEHHFLAEMIRQNKPIITNATSGEFLPQMLNLIEAIDFNKGCYLGQEIVARAQHRGSVKRKLRSLQVHGEAPEAGHRLTDDDGNRQGIIVNAATTVDGTYVLAVSPVDGQDGFTVNGTRFTPSI